MMYLVTFYLSNYRHRGLARFQRANGLASLTNLNGDHVCTLADYNYSLVVASYLIHRDLFTTAPRIAQ